MDSEVAMWEEQAADAIRMAPDKQDKILARLNELKLKKLTAWHEQALQAVDQAPTKQPKIEARFRELASDIGYTFPKDADLQISAFRNVEDGVLGGARKLSDPNEGRMPYDTLLENLNAAATEIIAPEGGDPALNVATNEARMAAGRKQLARETAGPLGRLYLDAQGVADNLAAGSIRAGANAAGIGGGVLSNIVPGLPGEALANDAFSASDKLRALADSIEQQTPNAADATRLASIVPDILGGFAVEPFERGRKELLKSDGTSTDASLSALTGGAINVANLAAGMLGSQSAGKLAMASRALNQVPAGMVLGQVDRDLRGEHTTEADVAADIGLGLFGSIFRNAPHNERASTPKTGDPVVDAGIDAVDKTAGASQPSLKDVVPEQGDLFSPQHELSVDMLNGQTVPASLMEQRRLRQERANRGEEPQRTEAEDLALERDYLLDQQQKRDAQMRIAQTEPPAQADLANFGIPEVSREPTSSSLRTDAEGNPVSYTETGTNTALRDAFRDAGERRTTGLQNQDMFGGPYTEPGRVPDVIPEPFNPSRNKTVDQRPIQETMELPAQQDLFGNIAESVIPDTPAKQQKAAKAVEEAVTNEQLLEALNNGGRVLFADESKGSLSIKAASPQILEKLRNGTLTTRDVLDEASKSLQTDTPEAKVASNLVHYLNTLADRIGGKDVAFTILDPQSAIHNEVLKRNEKQLGREFAAFYDPKTNKIYFKPSTQGKNTLIHEAAHGITSMLIANGEAGRLKGDAMQAYGEFVVAFENFKPVLEANAKLLTDPTFKDSVSYGLTDLHEFISEFFSNGVFRNSLKKVKVDPQTAASYPRSLQGIIKRATSMYDVVVGSLSNLMARAGLRSRADLGLASKAESAYEVMFHNMDRFFNSVTDADAKALKDISTRNTPALGDTSFLGEQVEQRVLPAREEPKLQAPRNRLVTALRGSLLPKGIEPKVTEARAVRTGEQAAGIYRAATIGNRLNDGLKRNPAEEQNLSAVIEGREDPRAYLEGLKDPKFKEAVRDFLNDRVKNTLALVREVAENPNSTASDRAWAATLLRDVDKYTHRAYEGNLDPPKKGILSWMGGGYMGRKLALASKAETKLGERSNAKLTAEEAARLTPDEAKNLDQLRGMRRYVSGWFTDNPKSLDKLSLEELGDRYQAITKLDPTELTRNLPTADKATALRAAYLDALHKTDVPILVDNMIKAMSGLSPDKTGAVISYVRNMRLGSDVMAQRENIPAVVRDWLGEIHHPVAKMIQTLTTQTTQLAQLKSMRALKESGMGTLFTDKESPTHTVVLTGERMGSLQGLRTTPDVKKAMDSILKIDQSTGDLIDAIVGDAETHSLAKIAVDNLLFKPARALSTTKKLATVVFNPGRWGLNILGSFGQLATNGNINLASMKRGVSATLAALSPASRRKTNPDVELLYRYGIWEPTQIEDIYSGIGRQEILDMIRSTASLDNPIKMAANLPKKAVNLTKEGYAATDLWTKAANFFNDVKKWEAHNKKIGKKMSEEQLHRFVADRINNTNITPSRAPTLLRAIEKHGGTQYLPYQFETFRTTYNNVLTGASDARVGIKTGDVEMLRYGVQRMLGAVPGMLYSQTAYHAGVTMSLGAMGYAVSQLGEDDKRREFLDLDPSKLGSQVVVLTDSEGKEYTVDIGQIPPMDPAIRPIESVLKAIYLTGEGKKDEALKQIQNAGDQIFNLVSKNSMYGNLKKAATGAEPSVARSNPELYKDIEKQMQDAGFSKGTYDRVINLAEIAAPKGLLEYQKGKYAETDDNIKALIKSGIGVKELNPTKDLVGYFGQSRKREIADARKGYADMLKQGFDANPEVVEKNFVEGLVEAAKPYKELQIAVDAAKKQGKSRREILQYLKNLRIGDEASISLLRGRGLPVSAMIVDLKADLKEKLLESQGDPAKRAEVRKRFRENTRLMNNLHRKYRNKTIEELTDA